VLLGHVSDRGFPSRSRCREPLAALELDLLRHHLQLPALRVLEVSVGLSKKADV
jgi:hypothetical protein